MGLVLDSGVLIAGEREAKPLSNLLLMLEHEHGETEIVLSAITVIELEHGLHRAQTAEQAQNRREYTAARPHNSVCRSADGRHCAPLCLRAWHPESAALPHASQSERHPALRPALTLAERYTCL